MPTPEVGNFDSEGAAGYLGELVNQFVETVDEILADEDRSRLDEEGESILMPNVELIALLCERYSVAPPPVAKIEEWSRRYLAIYDAQIDALRSKKGYKEQRRKAIDQTFHWLHGMAESY